MSDVDPKEPESEDELSPDDDAVSEEELSAALADLKSAGAPLGFGHDVEHKIRERSAGRFFGDKTFMDLLPVSVVALIALLVVGVLYFFVWSSDTGPLEPFDDHPNEPEIVPGAEKVVPRP
jgi:phosphotransferase system  glucose/maltose/N-acetylglucosamine-specific IIC component